MFCSSIDIRSGGGVDKYPAKAHARRVANHLGTSTGVIVLEASKAELWPKSDFLRPFRQDRDFYYLSGCNESDTYITYDIGEDLLTLWLPEIDDAKTVWLGRGSTVEEAREKYDIDDARYWHHESKATDWPLLTTGGSGATWYRLDKNRQGDFEKQENGKALRDALDASRVIKDEDEIRIIRRANEITTRAHIEVMKQLHKFTSEAQVEAAYIAVCIANHAKIQAYAPIAGAGANASILHYSENADDFPPGQTLVLDAGCEVSCYASDVTRTMPINPKAPGHWASPEAENIYRLVEKVQERCICAMGPGRHFTDIVKLAVTLIVDGLLELDVLKGDREDIIRRGTYRGFFPHGLGHHMGLDCHDVSPTGPTPTVTAVSALQPGMIVTIEPGIYFNHALLGKFFLSKPEHREHINEKVMWRYMRNVGGVRIEDDILITRTGYENLTTTPKGQDMLELIRRSASDARKDR